jgi:hypothetical protein
MDVLLAITAAVGHAVEQALRYVEVTTGFLDSWPRDIYFISTTEASTQGSTRSKNGWMRSGNASPLNIDGWN